MTRKEIAERLIATLQDGKLVATEQDWLDWSIRLTSQLHCAGYDTAADDMRHTESLAAFRLVCAEAVFDVFPDTLEGGE